MYVIYVPLLGGAPDYELCRCEDAQKVGALLAALLPLLDWSRGRVSVGKIDVAAPPAEAPPPWKEV